MKNHEHRDKKYAKYWCAGDLGDHGRYEEVSIRRLGRVGVQEDTDDRRSRRHIEIEGIMGEKDRPIIRPPSRKMIKSSEK